MEDIAIDDGRGGPLVPGAHRVVRTLDATEGPFPGTLVTNGDGVAVRVDAAALGGWVGWGFSGAEHIAAPIDVVRRQGGHDVLLPWCIERVCSFLGRRSVGGGGITPGETTTLVVSLLRGLDELGEGIDGMRTGAWWLTDGGRPVFVLGDGTDARTGTVEILEQLTERSSDKVLRRATGAIEEALRKVITQPRLPRRLTETWEQSMLDVAAPQPLEREIHAAERARDVARAVVPHVSGLHEGGRSLRADRTPSRGSRRGSRAREAIGDAMRSSIGEVLARVDRMRGTQASRTGRQSVRRGRSAETGKLRRRSLLVAGAAAALVLAGGLLLPEGEASVKGADLSGGSGQARASSSPEDASPAASPSVIGAPEESEDFDPEDSAPEGSEPEESAAGIDPVAAASSLLRAIADCRAAGDTSCADAVSGDAARVMKALDGLPPSAAELVDEYGDVAVVRLASAGREGGAKGEEGGEEDEGSDQTIVVLIRTGEKWLVRDVYDVADQPG
ncbi:hypothetical protein [Microbacterium maritypicum]|uniref:hypothetical protein n=1 Tax=Microbacterium maritypicum TaxID=33918 RepID=UPI003813E0BA